MLYSTRVSPSTSSRCHRACAHASRHPGHSKKSVTRSADGSAIIPVTVAMPDLPNDGEVLTEREMTCDPEERNCQTPMFVYEDRCLECQGSGMSTSHRRGRRMLITCPVCAGVGYVRHVTSRYEPSVNGSLSGRTSLFRHRPPPTRSRPPLEQKEYGDWTAEDS